MRKEGVNNYLGNKSINFKMSIAVILYYFISFYDTLNYIILLYIMFYYVISYYFISYYLIAYYFIILNDIISFHLYHIPYTTCHKS